MFLATICLFTMNVCRVTLVTPDLQFMFTVPSPLDVWRREAVTMGMALGDGLLQEVSFSDSTEAAEDTGSGELAGFQNHHQQWCVR